MKLHFWYIICFYTLVSNCSLFQQEATLATVPSVELNLFNTTHSPNKEHHKRDIPIEEEDSEEDNIEEQEQSIEHSPNDGIQTHTIRLPLRLSTAIFSSTSIAYVPLHKVPLYILFACLKVYC